MKAAVLVFPGINRERDMARTLELVSGSAPAMVWHAEHDIAGRHRSGGDPGRLFLRRLSALRRDCGALADHGRGARAFAAKGGLVLGVCNGFQILCEAGLLPGVLMRNENLRFICRDVYLQASSAPTRRSPAATTPGQVIRVPVAHGEGNYIADGETIARLEGEGRVIFRYCLAGRHDRPELEPQRRHQRHRRHRQRARQRARHDAASGKPRRSAHRRAPTAAACSRAWRRRRARGVNVSGRPEPANSPSILSPLFDDGNRDSSGTSAIVSCTFVGRRAKLPAHA